MSKSIKLKNEIYIDSNSVAHKKQNLSELLNRATTIVDVTQNINNRTITSKISFDDSRVMFFVFEDVSAWSNHALPIAIFNNSTENISIFGNWESQNTFSYNSIFEIIKPNKIRVKKYAQGTNMDVNAFTNANDTDFGAIRPNKIYAIMSL